MSHRRRLTTYTLAAVVLAGSLVATATPATADPGGWTSGGAAAEGAGSWVTLLTGDRVHVDGDVVSLDPADGRAGVGFSQYARDGRQYVVPNDALRLVSSGGLDERLFDVTGLAEAGYDDASTARLPTIVTYDDAAKGPAALRGAAGSAVDRKLSGVDGAAVSVVKEDATAFWDEMTVEAGDGLTTAPGIERIWLDGKREVSLDVSVPQIGAPAAWDAGYDGTGVTVAILDTGIDETHPDFTGKIAEAVNFTDAVDTGDLVGHGTHVASTIAGSGAASDGKFRGVSPGASLLIGKICTDRYCQESAILAGMQWAAPRADVINMSLGGDDFPGVDLLEEAVNTLTAETGALFVIAAGNNGRDTGVGSPATADAALAVGAVDKQDDLAAFSNRGPRVDGAIKPDITAPGVGIVAALGKDSAYPVYSPGYTQLDGTSMATPHVAGAAALLAQRHPDWDAEELKAGLMASAKPNPELGPFQQGSGRVDVARAVNQAVLPSVSSLALGTQPWPAEDDVPVAKTVAYRNDGTEPVTLDLTTQVTGPEGGAVPAGMFAVSPARLTILAGGTAEAVFTVDTRIASATGTFTGALTASSADGVSARIPFVIAKSHETRDLTIRVTDRDGSAATDYFVNVVGVDDQVFYAPYSASGTITIKVRAGRRYHVQAVVVTPSDGSSTLLVQPNLTTTEGTEIALDARAGTPVSVTGPDRKAKVKLASVGFDRILPSGYRLVQRITADGFAKLFTADLGDEVTADEGTMVSEVRGFLAVPAADGTFVDSPKEYLLVWFERGHFLTDVRRTAKQSELAVVTHRIHAQNPDVTRAYLRPYGLPAGGGAALSLAVQVSVPSVTTVYTMAEGVDWQYRTDQLNALGRAEVQEIPSGSAAYRPGGKYAIDWMKGPLGPRFTDAAYVLRDGNSIGFHVPIWGGPATHTGWSELAKESWKGAFYQDGTKIAQLPAYFYDAAGPVPADEHTYRLEYGADRPGYTVATSVQASWTFTSSQVASGTPTYIPLATFLFTPKVDLAGSARGGLAFVPVSLQRQSGAATPAVSRISVEISYDDGATWKKTSPVPSGHDSWLMPVLQPKKGAVSLRASASFADGSTADYTIIRAYTLH